MKKQILSQQTAQALVSLAFKTMRNLAHSKSIEVVKYIADHTSFADHVLKMNPGLKSLKGIDPSEPVLMEWRRKPEPSLDYVEIVFITPHHVLHMDPTGRQLRKVTRGEVMSYARLCPEFAEFVHERVTKMLNRMGKHLKTA